MSTARRLEYAWQLLKLAISILANPATFRAHTRTQHCTVGMGVALSVCVVRLGNNQLKCPTSCAVLLTPWNDAMASESNMPYPHARPFASEPGSCCCNCGGRAVRMSFLYGRWTTSFDRCRSRSSWHLPPNLLLSLVTPSLSLQASIILRRAQRDALRPQSHIAPWRPGRSMFGTLSHRYVRRSGAILRFSLLNVFPDHDVYSFFHRQLTCGRHRAFQLSSTLLRARDASLSNANACRSLGQS